MTRAAIAALDLDVTLRGRTWTVRFGEHDFAPADRVMALDDIADRAVRALLALGHPGAMALRAALNKYGLREDVNDRVRRTS